MPALQKILRTSLGAALMTEDRLRTVGTKLTGQAKTYLLQQARDRKNDFAKIMMVEFAKFLQKINIHEEIRKALEGLTIEVRIRKSRRFSK